MHEQMQAIHAEKDPEKRKQLMQEHRKSMHEGMEMMHGMMGGGMMMGMHGDASKENGKKHKHGKGEGPMDPESRMNMMEERMDMMQMMMEQMMQHEEAKHQHPKK
jgi:hypothetical protein